MNEWHKIEFKLYLLDFCYYFVNVQLSPEWRPSTVCKAHSPLIRNAALSCVRLAEAHSLIFHGREEIERYVSQILVQLSN